MVTRSSALATKVTSYGKSAVKRQVTWFHDYMPLMIWFLVPLFAGLIVLAPGVVWTAPGEAQETNYWMLFFRSVLFLVVLFAFSGTLAKACAKIPGAGGSPKSPA